MKPATTEMSQCALTSFVGLSQYPLGSVAFVCPGGKLSAGSVIQVMPTLPLGPVAFLDLGSV